MLRWLTLLVAIHGFAAAIPYSCSSNVTTYPQLPSGTFSFPTIGSDAHYQSPQVCQQSISINDGYYAVFDFATNLGPSDRLIIAYDFNNLRVMGITQKQVRTAAKSLFIRLEVAANSVGTFSYTVTWKPIVPPSSPMTYTLNDFGFTALPAMILNYINVVTFTMQNSNLVASLLLSCPNPTQTALSSAITVQNGTSVDTRKTRTPYYTLYDATGYHTPEKLFDGRSLTLYNPMPNVENTDCGIIAFDKRIVQQFSKVTYEYVTSYGNFGTFTGQGTVMNTFNLNSTAMYINTANSQPATIIALRSTTATPDFLIAVYQGMAAPGPARDMPIDFLTKNTPLPYKFSQPSVTLAISSGSVYYNFMP